MPQSNSPHPARAAALQLLNGVTEEGSLLSELTAQDWFLELAPADRARSQRLALETLRHGAKADRVLKPMMRKAPPDDVRHILRLGIVEVAALGAPAHGVVGDMVAAAGAGKRTRGFKGMVNAVLRKATVEAAENWGKMPIPQLPTWLRKPLQAAYGNSAVQSMEGAHVKGAPLDLTPKADAQEVAHAVGGTLLPTGSVRLADAGRVSGLPGYEEGAWWVQDAAAALPVQILAPQKGETIADLCAAPGGKTLQLAAAGAKVTAVDTSAARLKRVAENLARTKLTAEVVEADVLSFEGQFDAVLLDAPCSATGTIRRHADLPHARDGGGISELIKLQTKMLNRAVELVRPGGRLLFCTCSLIPDEGEVQVEDLLRRRKDISADVAALKVPGVNEDWITEEGGLRLRPDYWPKLGGMDGFYIACLRKS